jgi:hypothetical protein
VSTQLERGDALQLEIKHHHHDKKSNSTIIDIKLFSTKNQILFSMGR